MLPIASVRMVANQKLSRKDFVSARTELGRSKECCCLPLRLPKSYFCHNRHFATSTMGCEFPFDHSGSTSEREARRSGSVKFSLTFLA